jgi:hypothetical protein
MKIDLTTPALLFPAISLLLLAFTNRFLALAALIRNLHDKYKDNQELIIWKQIRNLKLRVNLIRSMQAAGVLSLFCCVISMFLIFSGNYQQAEFIFGIGLILLMVSLALSVIEIQISVGALNIQLRDIKKHLPKNTDEQ